MPAEKIRCVALPDTRTSLRLPSLLQCACACACARERAAADVRGASAFRRGRSDRAMQNIVDKVFPHFAKEETAAEKAMQRGEREREREKDRDRERDSDSDNVQRPHTAERAVFVRSGSPPSTSAARACKRAHMHTHACMCGCVACMFACAACTCVHRHNNTHTERERKKNKYTQRRTNTHTHTHTHTLHQPRQRRGANKMRRQQRNRRQNVRRWMGVWSREKRSRKRMNSRLVRTLLHPKF